jgi:uncharacterized cupin superfamily protein
MPKIDVDSVFRRTGSAYPKPFDAVAQDRVRQRLGDAGGIGQFGVNLLTLPPGSGSSQRHWHTEEDEFVFVVSGEVTLVSDKGEEVLRAGECAAFPRNVADGHQLINKSSQTAVCLEIGGRSALDVCTYSDIDMMLDKTKGGYTRKDGTPY